MDHAASPAAATATGGAENSATPSKRTAEKGAGGIAPVSARTRSHDHRAADSATGSGAASPAPPGETPSKRPRVSEEGDSGGAGEAGWAAMAVDTTDSSDAIINDDPASGAPAASSRPQHDASEVIDMTGDTPTPPKGQVNSANPVQIKQDPGINVKKEMAAPLAPEDDSDVEILTPSRFPRPTSSGSNNNIGMDMDVGEDGLMVAESNVTNASIDYPHMRSSCGVNKFVYDAQIHGYPHDNEQHCAKCYCFVCDVPAAECDKWNKGGGNYASHCHAHDKDKKWVGMREATLKARGVQRKPEDNNSEVTLVAPAHPPANPYQRHSHNPYPSNAQPTGMHHQQLTSLIHNEFRARLAEDGGADAAREQHRHEYRKEKKDQRITEVLMENFRKAVSLRENALPDPQITGKENNRADGDADESSKPAARPPHQKMEGDIPTLSLHNSFFVQGIKIGWPFPEVMKPQRQMAIHLIKALKASKHVVLESPTGTGKSAAILCSVLSWQRHHFKMESMKRQEERTGPPGNDEEEANRKPQKVKVIYCSRTHSQVAQMVASLKSTPYRPRMAILGSRERLCIHKSIKPRGRGAEPVVGVNVNNECRLRVRNTEKARRHLLTNSNGSGGERYDDDDPPEVMNGDGEAGGATQTQDEGPAEGEEDQSWVRRNRTCPHYRQLTTSRVANLAHATFVPSTKVDCCSAGGKQSKYGAHDIEDLVNFGVDPYKQKDVALYRKEPGESFGLSLKGAAGRGGGCFVRAVKPGTPADQNGSIHVDDKILRVNGSDVSSSGPADVVNRIKGTTSDPLVLDVSRGGSGSLANSGQDEYSSRAACPYYLSQVLSKDADIIFAPYNYVLDPGIRDALGIELGNSIVILDEAHNVESTLREAGSGQFGEFELCELVVMLSNFALTERSTRNMMDTSPSADPSESESQHLCDVAHALLLFVEKVANKLRMSRTCFQNNPGKKGAANALKEWEKWHTPDDHEFEISFDGPTGRGQNGKCVGCLPFFEKLGLTKDDFQSLGTYVDAFAEFFRGHEGNAEASSERDRVNNLVDRLAELVHKFTAAIETPEHYYAAVVATANGSLEYASGAEVEDDEGGRGRGRRAKKAPRALPLMPPKTIAQPNRPANPCPDPSCRARSTDPFNPVRHGEYCDGSKPKWEAHLHLDLLTPGPLMQELSNECRTVVLASGSLAPIPSLCAELNLFPVDGPLSPARSPHPDPTRSLAKVQKRLQNHPRPLEADHVIDLEKQLFALSIGHFPDGSELRVSQKNYSREDFLPKLGDALVRIVSGIPEGGVLVFLPSYALLRKCERCWNPNSFRRNNRRGWWNQNDESDDEGGPSVWDRLKAVKHNVIVEPSGSQDLFEEKKQEYMDSVKTMGGCVLLAVYRGKMSEGISFNDNNARGVVCVGLPLPNAFALPIKAKRDYNDEQRKLRNRTDLLPGQEWYRQQAYRAIAQALGRCIRHAGDYGCIFLLDIRHCDDGSPNNGVPEAHKDLPKWMRTCVKNLSRCTRNASGRSSMFNFVSSNVSVGWPGLKPELQRFFRNAKPFANNVVKSHAEKIAAASSSDVVHTYNVKTNKWSASAKKSAAATSSCQSNGASTCQSNEEGTSTASSSLTQSSSAEKSNEPSSGSLYVVDRQPSKASSKRRESNASAKKKGTLQEMFKKQQQGADGSEGSSGKKRPLSSSSKPTKRPSAAPNTLKSMFEKQRSAASSNPASQPDEEMIDVDAEESTAEQPAAAEPGPILTQPAAQPVAQPAPPPETPGFSFKRSPFATDLLTPAAAVAASTSQLALSQGQAASAFCGQSQPLGLPEDEERFCVVCEDGKKEVLLLPCKHMCLCSKCADECLLKTIHECPMCRTKIADSMQVFW
ncbi:hypothetical protein ACHAXT_010558 [Thalassiosira profunda]